MKNRLTSRPNLEHFRSQAKTLLAGVRAGKAPAVRAFIAHLPKANGMSASEARAFAFRLTDAQSVVARQSGFQSWTQLTRHVEQLRALEGEWHFDALEVDGVAMPRKVFVKSKLLFDGDCFRMESPEGNFEGRFTIDAQRKPMHVDIEFVEGPEAGNSAYGLFTTEKDALVLCVGVVGASRPTTFATSAGSGHALERLRRASVARPTGVAGGVAPDVADVPIEEVNNSVVDLDFSVTTSPMLTRLEGTWLARKLVTAGKEMNPDWLPFGSREGKGNETKVVFNGQVMLHAKVRIDNSATPIRVDYLHLHGKEKGKVSLGIMQWLGDEVSFLIAAPGRERPADISACGKGLTFSQWRRKGTR